VILDHGQRRELIQCHEQNHVGQNLEVIELLYHTELMAWTVILLDEVTDWYFDLVEREPESAKLVAAAIDVLEADGPNLGRPLVDSIKGSSIRNLKELRPGSRGRSEIRILFVFDPVRQAVLLVAGDKAGNWSNWYREQILLAERRYATWLESGANTECE
jgi:hypothetical protein